jgi:hypothetical protein
MIIYVCLTKIHNFSSRPISKRAYASLSAFVVQLIRLYSHAFVKLCMLTSGKLALVVEIIV